MADTMIFGKFRGDLLAAHYDSGIHMWILTFGEQELARGRTPDAVAVLAGVVKSQLKIRSSVESARTTRGTGIGRPPKKWFGDCVKGVRKSGRKSGRPARDPQSICGALWYRKMSASGRQAALAREGKRESSGKRTRRSNGRCRTGTGRFTRC